MIQPEMLDLKGLATLLPSDAVQPVAPVAEPQILQPQIQVAVAESQSQQAATGNKKRVLIYAAAGGSMLLLLVGVLLSTRGTNQSSPKALGQAMFAALKANDKDKLYNLTSFASSRIGHKFDNAVNAVHWKDASFVTVVTDDRGVELFDHKSILVLFDVNDDLHILALTASQTDERWYIDDLEDVAQLGEVLSGLVKPDSIQQLQRELKRTKGSERDRILKEFFFKRYVNTLNEALEGF